MICLLVYIPIAKLQLKIPIASRPYLNKISHYIHLGMCVDYLTYVMS